MGLFEEKTIKPMLIDGEVEPFDSPDYLFELKLDGERCIAYLDPKEGTELRNKRNVRMLPKVPELAHIHRQVRAKCILDGELTILKDGKPDFSEIQRRSLMSNPFKIELAAKALPACFTAFDILYYKGESTMGQPLLKRKALLQKAVAEESPRMALSRTVEGQGLAFFALAKERGLEGVMGKRKDSTYTLGKRTKNWVKIKNMLDDDFIICGYIRKEHYMTSLVLGQYQSKVLHYKGHVTLGVSGKPFQRVLALPQVENHPFAEEPPSGHENENATWVTPTLVCTVKYMEKTAAGGLRQPVFKGLREDKLPQDCIG